MLTPTETILSHPNDTMECCLMDMTVINCTPVSWPCSIRLTSPRSCVSRAPMLINVRSIRMDDPRLCICIVNTSRLTMNTNNMKNGAINTPSHNQNSHCDTVPCDIHMFPSPSSPSRTFTVSEGARRPTNGMMERNDQCISI